MAHSRPFGRIRKLTSGRHRARYDSLGKQVPAKTTFATKAETRAWLATMETDSLGGRHVNPTSGRELFGVYAHRWLEPRDLRPRTRDTRASQLVHSMAEFENVELRQIAPAGVRARHGRLAKSDLHANTVAKIYRLFRTMMDTIVDNGLHGLHRVNPVHINGAAIHPSKVQRLGLGRCYLRSPLRRTDLTHPPREPRRADAASRAGTHVHPRQGSDARAAQVGGSASDGHDSCERRQILAGRLGTYADEGPDAFAFTSIKGSPLRSC